MKNERDRRQALNLKPRLAAEALRYAIFNKPFGVLSQFTPDIPGQKTLGDFDIPKEIYPAGRLDKDSEGLLLLTNDGGLIKRLLDPERGHERTYLVQVEGIPTLDALRKLREGVEIEQYWTRPAKVTLLPEPPVLPEREPPIRQRKNIPTSWLSIILTEGKNRQVRKMTASVGYPTLRLVRTQIGGIVIGDLAQGTWRKLRQEEFRSLSPLQK